ncbi:MAG TPA: NHL repeat-containing protein [Candidatus Eremiobacteraceae bacterium]|nr:NHL repeat-containing protein [Candidatus Eremiobacteraceae bacterium]
MNTILKRALTAAPFAVALLCLSACKGSTSGGVVAGPTPPPSNGSVYLTDSAPLVGGGSLDQVLVFPQNTNGGTAPAQDITGNTTGLSIPLGIAVDHSGNMWVTNSGTSSITEYPAGATGDIAPINTVQGSATFLSSPVGIAVDANSDLFVVNSQLDSSGFFEVLEFGPNPTGNQAPIRRIGGAATLLNSPQYVVVDPSGNVYVTNSVLGASLINIFGPGAAGNTAPIVSFNGGCALPDGIALDASNNIYAACDGDYTIREYSALNGSNIPTQIRSLGVNSSLPQLFNPSGIALNPLGTLFVANTGVVNIGPGDVTIYAPSFINSTAPGASIGGGNSNVFRPAGIALH